MTLAAREKLDNLIFVVNCNLQRLDGPVRGNGKIIQELEAAFRGAGWNVIKVIWGSDWDPLLAQDKTGLLSSAWARSSTASTRSTPSSRAPTSASTSSANIRSCSKLVEHLTDEQLRKLRRGGHDPEKVYAAYKAAVEHKRLADGHPRQDRQGLRPGRGRRRPQHHPSAEEAQRGRTDASSAPASAFRFRRGRAPNCAVLQAAGRQPGDAVPARTPQGSWAATCPRARRKCPPLEAPPSDAVSSSSSRAAAAGDVSTTMAFVDLLQAACCKDKELGKCIVPIIPDEARTFGMESLFTPVRHLLQRRPALRAGRFATR